jgi:hypothetical protein
MDKPEKLELHPVVKEVNTLVAYAMLEYNDSKEGKLVDRTKFSPEEMTLYLSRLHARMFAEIESNKDFRLIMLTASRLILQTISGVK